MVNHTGSSWVIPLAVLLLYVLTVVPRCSAEYDWLSGGRVVTNVANTPYVASWTSSSGQEVFCAATAVSSRMLVTSSRCIVDYMGRRTAGEKNATFVVVGALNKDSLGSSERYEVEYIVPYPRFVGDGISGYAGKDVGLLFTKTEMSNEVKPVLIANFDPPAGYNMTVTGWSADGSLVTGKLQQLSDDTAIAQLNQSLSKLYPDEMFFGETGDFLQGGENSAIPAVLSNYLFAISSRPSPTAQLPRIFTRVSQFSSWISSIQSIHSTAPSGVVTYVLAENVSFTAPTAPPVVTPGKKPRGRRRPKKKAFRAVSPPNPATLLKSFDVLVPRDLRSVTFQVSPSSPELPLQSEMKVWLMPKTSLTAPDCVSDFNGTCSFLAPLEGIYHVEVRPLSIESSVTQQQVRVAAHFEHRFGYRMVRSVYNSTLLAGKKGSYLAVPVVPGVDFTAKLITMTNGAKQRLLIGPGLSVLSPVPSVNPLFCNSFASYGQSADCLFRTPSNTTSISLTVVGDPKRPSDYGLEFSYGRFTQTSSKPGCTPGFPCRAHYTLNSVTKGQTMQYRKAVAPGTELGMKLDLFAGQSEVRVFIGEDDKYAQTAVECYLNGQDTVPGSTYYCSVMVPDSVKGDVRVFIKTVSKVPSSYEFTFFY